MGRRRQKSPRQPATESSIPTPPIPTPPRAARPTSTRSIARPPVPTRRPPGRVSPLARSTVRALARRARRHCAAAAARARSRHLGQQRLGRPGAVLDHRAAPWWFPPLPVVSAFNEINVRTYVHRRGHDPGVWFFSLDANCQAAVRVARWQWRLNYRKNAACASGMRAAESSTTAAAADRPRRRAPGGRDWPTAGARRTRPPTPRRAHAAGHARSLSARPLHSVRPTRCRTALSSERAPRAVWRAGSALDRLRAVAPGGQSNRGRRAPLPRGLLPCAPTSKYFRFAAYEWSLGGREKCCVSDETSARRTPECV